MRNNKHTRNNKHSRNNKMVRALLLIILMVVLLALASCQILREIPGPVWEHGLRIGGAIAREYIAERYNLDEVTREAVNAALRELNIEDLPEDEVPDELRQSIQARLRNAGYMGDELDAMTEAGTQYLVTRFDLADIIDQGVDRALEASNIAIGEEPIPGDFELFIRIELQKAGYSSVDINKILEKMYPEPEDVAAMTVREPRFYTNYMKAVAKGLRGN